MKHRIFVTVAVSVFLLSALAMQTGQTFAQQPTPTSEVPALTPTPNLEDRVYQLETTQTNLIEALKWSNDHYRWVITGVGGLIAVLVAIQSFATVSQVRRERERDTHQADREKERDLTERTGVDQISKIMGVVQQTLESRRLAEEEAREEARKARGDLETVLGQIRSLESFHRKFQERIRRARQDIEKTATQWAQEVKRHDFKPMTTRLSSFAQQFDTFRIEEEPLEEEPHPSFSPRVPYIRGIAALYTNQPEIARQHLTQVASLQQPEPGETQLSYNRRIANVYYYLGLIEANFGNPQNAIESFEKANQLDLQGTDFLTRVVTAETYVMIGNFDRAMQFIAQVEDGLRDMERTEGRLRNHQLRLRSRAALIKANMAILRRETGWRKKVRDILEPVHNADPGYYYATATLAQTCAVQPDSTDQPDPVHAQELFREAYEAIERSEDLHIVTEVRSEVLLRMVAGLCCMHGIADENRAGEHLDRADDLRSGLPRIGPQVCTVFSPLSKKNENSETIRYHVEMIRKGDVLLEPGK